MSLLEIARTLRDEHRFQSGRKISFAPRVFLGRRGEPVRRAARPGAPQRLAKKIAAGAQFIQTQYCYDAPAAAAVHAAGVEDLGLTDKVFILIGVGPLRSAKAAEWMRTHVPGLYIPDSVIQRLAGAQDQAREGRNLCIELIQEIRSIRGVTACT